MNKQRRAVFPVVFLVSLVALSGGATQAAERTGLVVEPDPRFELMSVIFRLASHPEYNMSNSKCPYTNAVDRHFGKFKDHPVIQTARRLRQKYGVSYDAPMSLAVHLDGISKLKLRVPISPPPPKLDQRWIKSGETETFLDQARDFAKKTGFEGFLRKHKKTYRAFHQHLLKKIKGKTLISWFEKLFGSKPGLQTRVVLSAINGGSSYGTSYRNPDGSEEAYSIIGMYKYDKAGMPIFNQGTLSLIVHEFAHSYANPIIAANAGLLEPAATRLFDLHQERMESMAYGNWKIMAYETLVRAVVQLYVRDHGKTGQAQKHLKHMRAKGFGWVGKLADLLDEHRQKHKKPDGLKSFVPKLKTFFENTARQEQIRAENAPKVVSMVPPNGSQDVDPGLTTMKITFDRPMQDRSWSMVGGGKNFPELGKISYDAAKKVLLVPVKLKPDWSYQLWLNSNQFQNFKSAQGIPLSSVEVRFKTRK